MPRPKSFDRDEVLEQAMNLFWDFGYGATSIQDLENHLGINRVSLYREFGSKHDLFLAALDKYCDEVMSSGLAVLTSSSDGLASIRRFFEMTLEAMLGLTDGYYRLLNDDTESPDLNYKTYDLASIRQLRLAVRASQKRLGGVKAPALVIQSTKDPLVGPDGAASLMERLGGRDKVLVALPFDRHVIVRGEGSEKVFDAVGRFVKRIAGEG